MAASRSGPAPGIAEPTAARPAVFLDRDGVLDEPVWDERAGAAESPLRVGDVRLVDGAVEGLRTLRAAGFALCVATNQPAAAKGTISRATLDAVDVAVRAALAQAGLVLDAWAICPHHPDGVDPGLAIACDCRKPLPGLLLHTAAELGLALERSWMVGDADSDMAAGRAAGCRTALVEHPATAHRRNEPRPPPDLVAPDLRTAALGIARAGR